MTTQRIRLLAAAAGLGEFTASELAAVTGAKSVTVRQFLLREGTRRGWFEQVASGVGNAQGRRWRVVQPTAIRDELDRDETGNAALRSLLALADEPTGAPADGYTSRLDAAEEAIARAFEPSDLVEMEVRARIAVRLLGRTERGETWQGSSFAGQDRADLIGAFAEMAAERAASQPVTASSLAQATTALAAMAGSLPSAKLAQWQRRIVLASAGGSDDLPPVMVLLPAGQHPAVLLNCPDTIWQRAGPPWAARLPYENWVQDWAEPLANVPCVLAYYDASPESEVVLDSVLSLAHGRESAPRVVVATAAPGLPELAERVSLHGCLCYPLRGHFRRLPQVVRRAAESAVGIGAEDAAIWEIAPLTGATPQRATARPRRQVRPAASAGVLRGIVREIDPVQLGVRPARLLSAGQASQPRYVERTRDADLNVHLRASNFVLIVGESGAGKTRTAYEAVARGLPDVALIAPTGENVRSAVEAAEAEETCVLWLDDMYRLVGPQGLASSDVDGLIHEPGCHRVILATITVSDLAKLVDRSDAAQQGNQDVVLKAKRVQLNRMFDDAELRRAALIEDPRIVDALINRQYGIAEYLSAGPDVFNRWRAERRRDGDHPASVALISAAIDCRRAGLYRPLPKDLIEALLPVYDPRLATIPAIDRVSDDDWASATSSEHGPAALTLSIAQDGREAVEVFSYLVDEYARIATQAEQVPGPTLTGALLYATATEAMRLGQTARDYGRYDIALAAFTRAVDLREQELGPDHPDTLVSRNKAARAMRLHGLYLEAEAEHREVMELQLRKPGGATNPDTLTSRDNLARVLRLLNRPDQAEAEHRKVLQLRIQVLGAQHPDTLTTRSGRARALLKQGDDLRARGNQQGAAEHYREAEREHRAVLAARMRLLPHGNGGGEDHPDTLSSRNDLGRALLAVGRAAEAEFECRTALEGRIRVLGENHPHSLSSHQDLGSILLSLGQFAEAEKEFRDAYLGRARILGRSHPDTRDSLKWLGDVEDKIKGGEADNIGTRRALKEPSDPALLRLNGRLPRLRDISEVQDPDFLRQLGLHPARTAHAYVEREIDDDLKGLLKESSFVILIGNSATGKTRTALEAAITMLADHVLVAPLDRQSVTPAVNIAAKLHECVLWLDDFYALAGPEGLVSDHVDMLIRDTTHHRVIIGTISDKNWDRFTDRSHGAAHVSNNKVLEKAHTRDMELAWSPTELRHLAAAGQEWPPSEQLDSRGSWPLYLTGGAELFTEWERARSSARQEEVCGAALVSAAVDCVRSGLMHPPSVALLNRIHHLYHPFPDDAETRAAAWRWATHARHATAALSLRPAASSERGDTTHVEVFSYLIDEYERRATVEEQVPAAVLEAILAEPDTSATEAMRIGETLRRGGHYEAALSAFEKAASDRSMRLGEHDPDTLASRNQLARMLRLTGRLEAAETEQTAVLAAQERVLGPNHEDTLMSRDNLARILRNTGRPDLARAEHEAVLRSRTRMLGEEHQATLTSRANRARALAELGQYGRALAEHQHVLKIRQAKLGAKHPETLSSRSDLARLLSIVGSEEAAEGSIAKARQTLRRAETLYREVCDEREQVLGRDHPDTVETREAHRRLISQLRELSLRHDTEQP